MDFNQHNQLQLLGDLLVSSMTTTTLVPVIIKGGNLLTTFQKTNSGSKP